MSRIDAGPIGDAIRALARDPEHKASLIVVREGVMQTWANVMIEGEQETARIQAGEKLLNRLEGTPVARNVNADGGNAPAVAVRRFFEPLDDVEKEAP